jgi:hypothetical protein
MISKHVLPRWDFFFDIINENINFQSFCNTKWDADLEIKEPKALHRM